MKKTFVINGKTYNAREFDFNLVCDLEELGIDISKALNRPMVMTRAYFCLCSGLTIGESGKEIEKHILDGNSLDEIQEVLFKELEESDFFQKMTGRNKTE